MKKLFTSLVFSMFILLVSISCSENSEQPSSPSSNSSNLSLSKDDGTTTSANGKLGIVGKLFDSKEADTIFGKVLKSLTISVDDLNAALDKGNNYILITIKNNQVVLRNESKQYLSNERVELGKNETLYIYSKSMIKELLKAKKSSLNLAKSTAAEVAVELRDGVLTLSYSDATLEFALPCPPTCAN